MKREESSQKNHNYWVAVRAKELLREYPTIQTDLPGCTQPGTFGGHRPDIVATKVERRLGGQIVRKTLLSEIETEETYASSHTREQLKAFRAQPGCFLEVLVPKEVSASAKMTLDLWGIEVDELRHFPA